MRGLFGFVEANGAGAIFGVVVTAEMVTGIGRRTGDSEVSAAVATEVEGVARAVFVFNTRDDDVGELHGDVGATGMTFRHGVAGGNDEINGDFGVFGVSVFAGVEQSVAAGSVHDFIGAFCDAGIHTKTPFLIMYSFAYAKEVMLLLYHKMVIFASFLLAVYVLRAGVFV